MMKAITLNGKQAVASSQKFNVEAGRILPFKRLLKFFNDSHGYDWEKKTDISLKVTFSA